MIQSAHIEQSTAHDLTSSQMRIWSGQMLEQGHPLYNMAFSFEFEGAIDPDLFRQAFQRLVNEQDALRLVISIVDEVPRQHFLKRVESPLEFYDFSEKEDPDAALLAWIETAKQRLFDVKELLYESALFQLSDQRFVWYINQHHLITDGWSYIVLYQALGRHYQELEQGKEGDATKAVSYEQYVSQHSFFDQSQAGDYWTEKKATLSNTPALYGRKSSNRGSSSRRVSVNLGKERTAKLKALCQDPDIRAWTVDMAMNNVFLALTSAFIHKVSGQSDFSVGLPSHNRTTPAAKKTAGLYMELLPLSTGIASTDTFLDLYRKGRDENFEVLKNAGYHTPPVEFLKNFNVLLNFIPGTFGPFADRNAKAQWIHPDHHDAGHHLRLQVHDFNQTEDYTLHFDLNDKVFGRQDAKILTNHFLQLVDAFIADKDQPIGHVELISEVEIEQIDDWNDTDSPLVAGETLLTAFEEQVEKTPDRTALVFKEASMSYREFNANANQVAHYLRSQGVQTGDVIGVQVERSLELMCCLYGLLKAGAVYLPIDVSNPADRTRFLLEDASVKLLFTKNPVSGTNCQMVDYRELTPLTKDFPVNQPDRNVTSEDTGYIIYTSGSTGKPKGVVGYHKGVCNKLRWRAERFPTQPSDVFIQKTPISFDVSLWELFWPLRKGAKLVIAPPEAHKDTVQLTRLIQKQAVSIIHFVPSMLNAFLAEPAAKSCATLRQVFCSGEALQKNTVAKHFEVLGCELYNLYGPTEASVEVTLWQCKPEDEGQGVPIGHTVPNVRHYVLDEHLKRSPIGTPGELFLAGLQVTRGYLNDPELTAKRFLPDPFRAGDKMYKTGDLVRYREDGALEYLGRTDHQIKLRGFRIELGEIEMVMTQHPDVELAVVTKVEQEHGSGYLVGYYTGQLVEENQMKSLIGQKLPAYMVPSFFMCLDEFQLSASGKIDRKKLPAHSIGSNQPAASHQPPETRLQEMIAEVWEEILQVDDIGIYDRFIDLGGDSLKALVVTSRIREMLDIDISVHMILQHKTIYEFANALEKLMIEIMSQEED